MGVDRVDEFLPERWSADAVEARKGTDKAVYDHALLRDSFGMGARSCLAKELRSWRFKSQQLILCVIGSWSSNLVNPGRRKWLLLPKLSRFQNSGLLLHE